MLIGKKVSNTPREVIHWAVNKEDVNKNMSEISPCWGHQDFYQANGFQKYIWRWFIWESVIAIVQTS